MINKPADVTKFEEDQVPVLNAMMDKIYSSATSIRFTNVLPTYATVHEGELVVYDSAAVGTTEGTMAAYVITRSGRMGKISLT